MTDAKIALVTGANKGIGLETARQLGAAGHLVLVGARSRDRGEASATSLRDEHIDARHVLLDVTDADTIKAAATWIDREFGRLDVLVNNAGIANEWGHEPTEIPIQALRDTYETNVLGVVAVTNAMLPLLRLSSAGRIVNMSSALGSLTLASDPDTPQGQRPIMGYNSSKAALNAVTVQYAIVLRDSPIKVNAANPGYCATDLNGHSGYRTAAQGAAIAVRLATLPTDGPSGGFFEDEGPVPW